MKKYKKLIAEAKTAAFASRHAINEGNAEYDAFFRAALEKFGKTGVGEMSDEEKKEFFNYIEKNYTDEKTNDGDE